MSEKPISLQRQRMIEDMMVRNFVEKTRNDYIRHVKVLAGIPQALAGHRNNRGAAQVPTAPDTVGRSPTRHQQLGDRIAVLLHRHGGPA